MDESNEPYELNDFGNSNKAFDSHSPSTHLTTDVVDEAVRTDASGKVTGTDADAMEMMRMGRTQELRRNFKALSVLGLATTTMSTWVAMLMTSTFSLINGGLAGTIFVYLATWLCTFALAASLAEMASMAPTSGGQYAWVRFGDPRIFMHITDCKFRSRNLRHARSSSSSAMSWVGCLHLVGKL